MKGFTINKLVLKGKDAQASLDFQLGLNYITGPSNRGKTFIFQCIDFMFGSKDSPKDIPEIKKYDLVLLEIQHGTQQYTVYRRIADKTSGFYRCKFEDIGDHTSTDLLQKTGKKGMGISEFYLDLIGIEDVMIRDNQDNHTVGISFRDLSKWFLINEETIITERSPLYDSMPLNRTKFKSMFQYFLTGKDDRDLVPVEKSELFEARKKGAVDFLTGMVQETTKQLNDLNKKLEGVEFQEDFIQFLQTKIEERENEGRRLRARLAELTEEINTISRDLQMNLIAQTRMRKLDTEYDNNIKRLSFIFEGANLFGQLDLEKCPVCGRDLDHTHDGVGLYDVEHLDQSIREEGRSLHVLKADLNRTISDTEVLIQNLEANLEQRKQLVFRLERQDLARITDEVGNYSKRLKEYMTINNRMQKRSQLQQDLQDFGSKLQQLLNEKRPEAVYDKTLPIDTLREFTREISDRLTTWNLDQNPLVVFDPGDMDVIINTKKRGANGKGYKAIYSFAMTLSLLRVAQRMGFEYSKVYIVDSPLTVFKEPKQEEKDRVHKSILTDLRDNYQDMQILVLENKEFMVDAAGANIIEFDEQGFLV